MGVSSAMRRFRCQISSGSRAVFRAVRSSFNLARLVCLKNWLGRVIQNWGHHRADMAEGCNEWFDPEMAKWIWNFNKQNRARYYELLNRAEGKRIVILKSRRQAERFLEGL